MTATSFLRQSAIEFMADSGCYVVTVPSFALTAPTVSYQHSPPADLQVQAVVEATIIGATEPLNLADPTLVYTAINTNVNTQYPTVFISGDDNISFTVWPAPAVNCTLTYRYSLRPTETAATLPDMVYNIYAEAIVAGAKAKLLALPDKAWTNDKLAMQHQAEFRNRINRAKIYRQRAAITAGQRVSPVWFGA